MFPQLAQAGHLTVYTYGVLTLLAVLAAVLWSIHLAETEGISAVRMEGLALVIVLSAGIGSKLLTALDYPGFYGGNWRSVLQDQVLGRGGVFYGGFLLAMGASALYCWRARLPGWQVADCVMPGLALAQCIGRMGCFFAGCCWGLPTHLPIAITFTSPLAHRISGVPLHVGLFPTQLSEAALTLLAVPFLLRLRKRKSFHGQVILLYALYYAVIRFLLEFVRGDPRGFYFDGFLSTSQVIGLLIIPVAIALYQWRKSKTPQHRGLRKPVFVPVALQPVRSDRSM
jgi:phosphatidylglycerol:prolipoprotein diacylglycerol transferase